jgi:hypothetical protein
MSCWKPSCCSVCSLIQDLIYTRSREVLAIFIDEYFDDPVIRFLAVLFFVCRTNFSTCEGKTVIDHVLDITVKQTVHIFRLLNFLSGVSLTNNFFLSGSCQFRA